MLLKAPKWLFDPLGPLSIPPRYLPQITPWLIRFWRASLPDRYRHSLVAQGSLMRFAGAGDGGHGRGRRALFACAPRRQSPAL